MKAKLTDEELIQALRDVMARSACSWGIYNYVGDRQQIAEDRYERLVDVLVHQVCYRLNGHSDAVVRARIRKLAPELGMTISQYKKGASIRVHAAKEFSQELKNLAEKWWELMGYCKVELRPRVPGHRLPDSEAELRSVVGGPL